ncbi:hypothetical protein J6590_001173 [Homalodisca vitripennis]|nr:hypothetical protein J6590_001173 [Homalodisca vitripennis]
MSYAVPRSVHFLAHNKCRDKLYRDFEHDKEGGETCDGSEKMMEEAEPIKCEGKDNQSLRGETRDEL